MIAALLFSGLFCQALADGPGEVEYLLKQPLIRAGIPINRESLIHALNNKSILIAGNSALLLPRFPKTRRMVEALTALVENDQDPQREILAVNAARSLVQLNERDWVPKALARLPKLRDRVSQVQLAGLLARVGHAEGWPIVRDTLTDENLALVALENVAYFNRLRDENGQTINVVEELNRLSSQAPEGARKLIEEKLIELRKKNR
ncbi:MAG: hypothetical protein WCB68_00710 [Pyrinomonadaceae bacterium]